MGDERGKEGGRSTADRVRDELRRYAIVSAYLFVCFSVVLLYRSAVLLEQGQHFLPFGAAAVKALVLGKFLLIGEALRAGERVPASTLLGRIAWRSLLLFAALIVMTLIEELVVGWAHGRPASASLGEFFGPMLPERLAGSLIVLLVLIPLVAVTELSRVLGAGRLRGLLRERVAERNG
jgi:uncharacterized membrane protein